MAEEIRGQAPHEPEEGQAPMESGQEPGGIEKLIKELRQEASSYRRRLRELEAVLAQKDEEARARLEEEQKARAEWERRFLEAQRALRERTLRYEVLFHAQRLGVADPELVWRALSGDELARIEWGEDDSPKGVEEVVRAFVEARPYLIARQGVQVAPTNPAREAVFRRSEMRRPEFWAKHSLDEVIRAMAEGRIVDDLS